MNQRLAALVLIATLVGCQSQPTTTAPAAALVNGKPARYIGVGAEVPGLGVQVCVLPGLLGKCPTPTPTPTPNPCWAKPYAVFTHSDRSLLHLAGLHLAGICNKIVGDTHSNDQTWMAGVTEEITGRNEARAGWVIAGLNNKPGTKLTRPAMDFPAPVYNIESVGYPMFVFQGNVDLDCVPEVWQAPGQLRPGVYRSTGRISISRCHVKGEVTLVAREIWFIGHDIELKAYTNDVVAFADGCYGKDIHFLGCDSRFTGNFLAYKGEVSVVGDQNRINGSVFSNTFDMIGLRNEIIAPDSAYVCDPTPGPTPTPNATPTPIVVPSSTPTPSGAPTLAPTPAPTPTPAATGTPGPAPSSGGGPGNPTPTPSPVSTPTPAPTAPPATPTPTPAYSPPPASPTPPPATPTPRPIGSGGTLD